MKTLLATGLVRFLRCFLTGCNAPRWSATLLPDISVFLLTLCSLQEVLQLSCGFQVPRSQIALLDAHATVCQRMKFSCKWCSEVVDGCEVKEHFHNDCPKRLVSCKDEGCLWTGPYDMLFNHWKGPECEGRIVKCTIPGCDWQGCYKDLDNHLRSVSLVDEHIILSGRAMKRARAVYEGHKGFFGDFQAIKREAAAASSAAENTVDPSDCVSPEPAPHKTPSAPARASQRVTGARALRPRRL